MPMTAQQQADAYQFFIVAFGAAPGTVYMDQLNTAYDAGLSTKQIVNIYTTKEAFTARYPNFLSNGDFATSLVNNVVGDSASAAAKTEAVADITAALNSGFTRGDVIFQVFSNLSAKDTADATWGGTAQQFANQVAVAKFVTQELLVSSTDTATLRGFLNGVTQDPATVQPAKDAAQGLGNAVGDIKLTVGMDSGAAFTGTGAVDMFKANVVQNALGQQVNTLGSGDELNGGGGIDTLSAKITSGVFAGGAVSMPIQPETKSIEIIKLQAVNSEIDGFSTEVYVNAKDMTGISKIGSNYSDANLVIQNLTTKDDAGVARSVSDLTVGMEYTGNADSRWNESDLSVYFDQDYLKAGVSNTTAIEIRIVNNLELAVNNKGLVAFEGLSFTVGTQLVEVGFPANIATLTGTAAYAAVVTAVQARLVELNISNVTVSLLPQRTAVFTDDIVGGTQTFLQGEIAGSYSPISIVSTNVPLTRGQVAVDNTTQNFNGLNTQLLANTSTDQLVTINVDLEKSGLAGDGGHLVIGSMNKTSANAWNAVNSTPTTKSGIEQFNVTVKGDEDKSSSLSALLSTNNNLRVVTVKTDAAQTGTSLADLTIGNSQTNGLGADVINKMPQEVLPSAANANALKDVQTFDASAFKGDLKITAGLTSEVTAKYMNLVDQAPAAAAADNVSFNYTGGTGNDVFNIALDSANLNNAGTTTREDFLFSLVGGAGNDNLTLSVVDALGTASGADNWYANSKLNANLRIEAGDGDDVVWTPGSGDVVILGGAGNDTVYSDNTGAKAIWAFNGSGAIDNLLSDTNNGYNLFKSSVSVNFKGLMATAQINSVQGRSDDLAINQAIKAAINSDPVLNKLLIATDGPANTLVVTSLIDGDMAGDLAISLRAPAVGSISPTEYAVLQQAYNTAATPVTTPAQVDALLAAGLNAAIVKADYVKAPTINGANGTGISDHNITGGADRDVMVLSTEASSNETLVYTAGFGNDTVVNLAVAGGGIDQLNFNSLLGGVGTSFVNDAGAAGLFTTTGAVASRAIIVDNLVAPVSPAVGVAGINNNNELLVANLFQDSGSTTAAKSFVYVAVNTATNIGSVYSVADAVGGTAGATTAVGGSNITATLQGTIDLADTLWSSLTATNFYGSTAVPTGPNFSVAGPAAALEGTSATYTVTLSAAQAAATTVAYTLGFGGTATAADLGAGTALNGVVTFAAGATTATVVVPFATDAVSPEAGEGVSLTVGASSATTMITDVAPVVGPVPVVLPIGSIAPVTATAAADIFSFDVAGALAQAPDTQITINNFATNDTLRIDLLTANAAITTLDQLAGVEGISLQNNPFGASGPETLINFGSDADGQPVVITLAGVVDTTTVLVDIV